MSSPAPTARWRTGWVSRWLPVVAWMGLIFVLSSQPGLRISADAAVDAPARAVAHVVTFGTLGALLYRALLGPLSPARAAIASFVIAALYGVSDELHQSLVPERTGQIDDVALDAAGAAIGIAVAVAASVLLRRRSSTRQSPESHPVGMRDGR